MARLTTGTVSHVSFLNVTQPKVPRGMRILKGNTRPHCRQARQQWQHSRSVQCNGAPRPSKSPHSASPKPARLGLGADALHLQVDKEGSREVRAHGVMSKLKNFVTGGACKVEVLFNEPAFGLNKPTTQGPFKVMIQVQASADVEYRRVALKVRSTEELYSYPVSSSDSDSGWLNELQTVTALDYDATMAGSLTAGEMAEWEVEVKLPLGAQRSFKGKYIGHQWNMEAFVDTAGVNPSSGQVEFQVDE